ncbi:unnamed protein product [Vitrella brassicaformis CCMP3155]|uniref:Uncharacterized protein n=1 Tax=Vitrella brassicaformis (strain CCMP3155) TaxID=1169540 RepID=A0A0G4EJT0_VITBC|nr:unnamed protein product [Vitrella brassicaformis CCMP3155]|eukprot:CEL96797.1 unnamed protein product [Vitrella brassicaformis CCMP3155]
MRWAWCRGTWVALVEGHTIGRAAIADKKRRETAAAAAAQDDDGSWSADEGTLEVLSFEAVELGSSIRIPYPPPSSDLPAAPSAPVNLPALKTVDNIPSECLAARVGRQWRTPAVKTLITRGYFSASEEAVKAWVVDCEAIEVLDPAILGAADAADVLSALPAHGKSLGSLRTLRGVWIGSSSADIDRLREVLVARGVKRWISELKIDMGGHLGNTDEEWERLQKTAQLVDAVAHREALSRRIVGNIIWRGSIDLELISRTSSSGTPLMQRIIDNYAKGAHVVAYSGGDEAIPAAITDDSFPAAHTLQLLDDALDDEAKKERALNIASHMPSLSCIKTGDGEVGEVMDAPVREVWRFLEWLQEALVSKGRERSLTLEIVVSAADFTAPLSGGRSPALWGQGSNAKRPPIEKVSVSIDGDVADDELERWYQHVMASLNSFNHKLKGHKRTTVCFEDDAVRTYFEQRFLAELAGLNLNGGPYEFSFSDFSLVVERLDT